MAKCQICHNKPGVFTGDPVLTPNHFLTTYRGHSVLRGRHLKEIQERVNKYETDLGLDLSVWSSVDARTQGISYRQVNEVRESMETIFVFCSVSLGDYLSQDENGDFPVTPTITEWLGGHRLSKGTIVRGMHIEELRLPLNICNLLPTDITITDMGSGVYDIAYTIKNDGNRKSGVSMSRVGLKQPPFYFEFSFDDATAILLKDETVTFHHTAYYYPSAPVETFTMRAIADVNNEVKELKENDNILDKEFTMRKPMVATTVTLYVHCHNPEGKELGWISSGWGAGLLHRQYDGESNWIYLGDSSRPAYPHPKAFTIEGQRPQTIRCIFNGITEYIHILGINLTETLTFVFSRTTMSAEVGFSASESGGIVGHESVYKEYKQFWGGDYSVAGAWCYEGGIAFSGEGPDGPYGYDFDTTLNIGISSTSVNFLYEHHQHHYAWAIYNWFSEAAVRLSCAIYSPDFYIPPAEGFNYWLSQGYYAPGGNISISLCLFRLPYYPWYGEYPLIPGNPDPVNGGYALSYFRGGVNALYHFEASEINAIDWGGYPTHIDVDIVYRACNFSNWKISSVPYDLAGTAP